MSRILLYDLETSPIISYNWGIWEQNAIEVIEDWQILCFAYKWLDERKTYVIGQDDFEDYVPGVNRDYNVVKKLWDLFNEADQTIAHNGMSFDEKKSNARFIQNGLIPPEPHKAYDTLRVARKNFGFTSNKLNALGQYLEVGKKAETGGFETWKKCIAGDPKAWRKMKRYNVQDVRLLEKVYLKMRPWDTSHPAHNVLDNRPESCPRCGKGKMIAGAKYAATRVNKYQYFRCSNCGASVKARAPEKIDKPLYT
jgi:hypothetical protein